jgi:hypothetical protein
MAFVTSNVNFLSVKSKVYMGPNPGHKNRQSGQNAGDENMEISPDKKKEEKMMGPPQQIVVQ